MPPITLPQILDLLGTFAFAVSGIRMASNKQMDWFGAYIIGLVTAIGGGTLRDLLLDTTPFWMVAPQYLLTTGVALFATILMGNKLLKLGKSLFLFDTIGLGLFTIVGITKSLDAGFPIGIAIIMGTITGTVGGVIRDVLLNEVPLLFRRDIYAMACVAGGAVFFLLDFLGLMDSLTEIIAALVVILVRLLAVRYHIHLPQLKPLHQKEN
jgi:uncharacterized membrane protein YeiH